MPVLTSDAVAAVLQAAGLPADAHADAWDRTPGIQVYEIPLAVPRVGLSFIPGPYAGEQGEQAAAVLRAAGYGAERVEETASDYYVVYLGDF